MKKSSEDKYPKTLQEVRDFEAKIRAKHQELFEKFGIRSLNISTVIAECNRGIHDEVALSALKKSFEVPLEKIFEVLDKLHADSKELKEIQQREETREKYAEKIAESASKHDDAFLTAFANLLISVVKLREDEEAAIDLIDWANVKTKKAVAECARLHPRIKEGAQSLSLQIAKIERLRQSKEDISCEDAARYIDELSAVFDPFGKIFESFQAAEKRFCDAADERNSMHAEVQEFDRQESALLSKLQSAEEWSREMQMDPYLALGEDKKVFFQSNSKVQDCRALLYIDIPSPPSIETAQKLVEMTEEILEWLMTISIPVKKKIVPAPLTILPPVEEEAPEAISGGEKKHILLPMQFAVCVYGAFCTNQTKLGRTARVVYNDFLSAHNLTCGFSLEDFRMGLLDAKEKGLLTLQTVKGKRGGTNEVWKPTKEGLKKAKEWFGLLPFAQKDFIALMRYIQEQKQKESLEFARKIKEKMKKKSQGSA